jgi:hypothetical protein
MKKWHYDQIAPAANGCVSGTLAEWPYLAEALTAQGIKLPTNTFSTTLQAICRLILSQSKIGNARKNSQAVKALREALLDRDLYVSDNDIAEIYGDYCESFTASSWLDLSYWQDASHIGPVDYIAARIGK